MKNENRTSRTVTPTAVAERLREVVHHDDGDHDVDARDEQQDQPPARPPDRLQQEVEVDDRHERGPDRLVGLLEDARERQRAQQVGDEDEPADEDEGISTVVSEHAATVNPGRKSVRDALRARSWRPARLPAGLSPAARSVAGRSPAARWLVVSSVPAPAPRCRVVRSARVRAPWARPRAEWSVLSSLCPALVVVVAGADHQQHDDHDDDDEHDPKCDPPPSPAALVAEHRGWRWLLRRWRTTDGRHLGGGVLRRGHAGQVTSPSVSLVGCPASWTWRN